MIDPAVTVRRRRSTAPPPAPPPPKAAPPVACPHCGYEAGERRATGSRRLRDVFITLAGLLETNCPGCRKSYLLPYRLEITP